MPYRISTDIPARTTARQIRAPARRANPDAGGSDELMTAPRETDAPIAVLKHERNRQRREAGAA